MSFARLAHVVGRIPTMLLSAGKRGIDGYGLASDAILIAPARHVAGEADRLAPLTYDSKTARQGGQPVDEGKTATGKAGPC